VRAALLGDADSRLTPDELKEVLMHSAIYAGVAAANTAFAHAPAILREVGPQIDYTLDPASPLDAVHPGVGREGRTASQPCTSACANREAASARATRSC
jgi:3-oxoadipate enol-lactonase